MRPRLISAKSVAEGLLTFIPGLKNLLNKNTGGTCSSKYCYTVWLRHYIKIAQTLKLDLSSSNIIEFDPGDSLGTGIAAMLSGCESYTAIDAAQHFSIDNNLKILDELFYFFNQHHPIPDQNEFPLVKPFIENYNFPTSLNSITTNIIKKRRDKIYQSLKNISTYSLPISFISTDSISEYIDYSTIDLIFSQAVFEHIDDLHRTYSTCSKLLKPGGLMSHTIDFKCHGASNEWNGHWAYPPIIWRILIGRRRYFINRMPLSYHLHLLNHYGFSIIILEKFYQNSALTRNDLAKEFHSLTGDDLRTAGVYILAEKKS